MSLLLLSYTHFVARAKELITCAMSSRLTLTLTNSSPYLNLTSFACLWFCQGNLRTAYVARTEKELPV
jgi:hypothetical protein